MFKVGDRVKHKFQDADDFVIVSMDEETSEVCIYSKIWELRKEGHDGRKYKMGNPTGTEWGHWLTSKENLTPIEQVRFNIGDKVKMKEVPLGRPNSDFFVVTMDADGKNMTIFSKEWSKQGLGHAGAKRDLGQLCIAVDGHWNVSSDEIIHCKEKETLITKTIKDEVRTKDSEGCPRGIESKIYSEPVQIASGSRPTGSRSTACRIGITVRVGSVNNNRVQPH